MGMASTITQPVFLQRDGQAELALAPSYTARSFYLHKGCYPPENRPQCYSNFIHNIGELKRSEQRETCSCCTPQMFQVFFEIFKYTDFTVIKQSINMSICIAPNSQKSSEVFADKQMSFELFLRKCHWKAARFAVPLGVCSMSPAQTPRSYAGRWQYVVHVQLDLYKFIGCHL